MARAPIVLEWPAGGGLDQFTDPRHVEQVQLVDAKNLRVKKRGAYGKRRGMSIALTLQASSAVGEPRMYALGDQVVIGDGTDLRSYAPSATGSTTSKAPSAGKLPLAQITGQGVWTGNTPVSASVSYGGGTYCVAWITEATVYCEVYDATTGAAYGYAASGRASTAAYVRTVYLSSTNCHYLAVSYTGSGNVDVIKIPLTGGAASTTTYNTVAGLHIASTPIAWKVAEGATDRAVLVYQNGANSTPNAITVSDAGAVLAGPTVLTEALAGTKGGMCLHGSSSDNMYLSYSVTTGGNRYVRYSVFNATTTALVLAATTVFTSATGVTSATAIIRTASTTALVAYSYTATATAGTYFATVTSGAVVTALTNATRFWTSPVSEFFSRAANTYDIWLAAGGAVETTLTGYAVTPVPAYTMALVTVSTATGLTQGMPQGIEGPRIGSLTSSYGVASVVSPATGKYATVHALRRDTVNKYELTLTTADFTSSFRWRGAVVGRHLLLSGGTSTYYDGALAREVGFAYDIQGPAGVTVGGGGTFVAGTYTYAFCYARTDRTGQIVRGAPSIGIDRTVVLNDQVTIALPCLSVTADTYAAGVTIEVYRTTASGSTFYLLGTAQNAPFAASVNFTDTGLLDATLATRPVLYTTGGEVANGMPPASIGVFAHKQRAFFVERDRLWFSKLFIDGSFPGFSPAMTIDMIGSQLVGGVSLDDTAILFERDRIWALVGDGPNAANVGGDYYVRQIASDLGCTESTSLVVHSGGVFFRSGAGLYNLNRGLQVEYLGRWVEDELTTTTTITSAIVHPTDHCVLFTLAGGPTTGRRLVYDYLHQLWLKDICTQDYYGQAVIGSQLYAVNGASDILSENAQYSGTGPAPPTYLDGGTDWIPMRAKFGWTTIPGSEWHRVRAFGFTGKRNTAHGLSISVYNAYNDTAASTRTWTDAELTALSDLPVYSIDVANPYPLSDSATVQIEDVAPSVIDPTSNTGEGSTILAVIVDAQQEQGTTRKPAANRR